MLLVEQCGEPRGGFLDVGGGEAPRRVVRRFARHARVVVAEERDPVDAEDLGRGHRLGDAPVGERLARLERFRRELAQLALGCDDEHDPVPVGLGPRHRARRWRSPRRRDAHGR